MNVVAALDTVVLIPSVTFRMRTSDLFSGDNILEDVI